MESVYLLGTAQHLQYCHQIGYHQPHFLFHIGTCFLSQQSQKKKKKSITEL